MKKNYIIASILFLIILVIYAWIIKGTSSFNLKIAATILFPTFITFILNYLWRKKDNTRL
ncbi:MULTISPECIES: hypothetical protein [Aerococcus]|uniref:Uncharacterized protein n=1 Tax=Aerococcus urinaeequi TaxID=51665 RepID=A0AAC9A6U9_9LACT|nr:hypothetical protein [Aerococcus urinaeequi]AMB97681.1 hypothetical protein AWM74_05295 [Aerococcus urinaeequi]